MSITTTKRLQGQYRGQISIQIPKSVQLLYSKGLQKEEHLKLDPETLPRCRHWDHSYYTDSVCGQRGSVGRVALEIPLCFGKLQNDWESTTQITYK